MGTSVGKITIETSSKDHPHACGDKEMARLISDASKGSSPRVWGQANDTAVLFRASGIIPTRVGTRGKLRNRCYDGEDHPHACGDKTRFYLKQGKLPGSSPRVWGQARRDTPSAIFPGIIPTRVGTRRNNPVFDSQLKDHPHACGDKFIMLNKAVNQKGSSPRVWGQDTCTLDKVVGVKDHPHACGDKWLEKYGKNMDWGSSPRVWGQESPTTV